MKILITNNYLKNKAGSELFTRDLAVGLKKRGHDIFVFSPILGEISDEIKSFEIKVTDNLLDFKNEKFDIIHAQHNSIAIMVRSVFIDIPMIFMSHGFLPEVEQPPSIDLGICKYLAVSEEVKDNLINKGIDQNIIEIVRNFIDTSKFKIVNQPNEKLKNILVLTNHYSNEIKDNLEKICSKLNLNLLHVGSPENSVNNVEDYINNSDLVITLGRGALESMSCGRNVLAYDIHGSDGLISENNFFEIRKNNFSGRKYSLRYSSNDLEKELFKYDKNTGFKLRELVLKENSSDSILSRLEKIYLECNHLAVENCQIKEGQLFNELNFLEEIFNNLDYCNNYINNKEKEIKEILNQKELELKNNNEIIYQKNQEINSLKNSTSWKITYPFRFFKDKIISFKNRFKIKTKIRNYKEFNKFKYKNKNIQEICKEITSFLNEKKEIVHCPISAKCEICGYKGEFYCSKIVLPEADFVAFSELFACSMCKLNNRQRASMKIFLDKIKNKKNKSIFLYEQITPYFNVLSKNVSNNNNIIGSEFLGYQHKSGDVINGVRNEDGMNLSLKDNSVDYVISNDVFEHIPDINKTFSEASRVLKSGGELIFTIPFHYDKDKTITRAIFKNNEIKNILPPIYHGNPVDIEGGSLCFHDFGWDILDIIKSCGFSDVYGIPTYNKENAHIHYDPIMTYIAIKK